MNNSLRDIALNKLAERAKELRCIYQVMEALKDEEAEIIFVFNRVLEAIPPGYQHPTVCEACIILEGKCYPSLDYKETPWMQRAEIVIDNHVSGEILVCYTQAVFEGENAFLQEEQKLLNTIAEHLSRYLFHRRLKKTLEQAAALEAMNEPSVESSLFTYESDEHWKWRLNVCEKIACMMDMERLGVEAVYVIGSTKNASAGPGSDIDLLVHFSGTAEQANELRAWIEGWGLGLAELNFLKTGYATSGSLIDLHIITNEDIRKSDSYAAMIGATDNSARLLRSRK